MSIVKVNPGTTASVVEVEDGIPLLEAVSSIKDMHIDASCGGKGTCGKCKLRILKGELSKPSSRERELLSDREIENGYRLSCMVPVAGDMDVLVDSINDKSQILTSHQGFTGKLNPLIRKKYLNLPLPSLDDQRDDLRRVRESIPLSNARVSLSLRRGLPALLRGARYSVTAVFSSDTLISVEQDNTEDLNYGIALDIGTTTIAAYLLDCSSGELLDSISALNTQKVFGADVISRIEFSTRGADKRKILQDKILTQIGDLSILLAERNGIQKENIYSLVLSGNTTMLHLAFGIDLSGIAVAPFIPGSLDAMRLSSRDLGNFPLNCTIYALPAISGYVGADIVAGILSTGMHQRDELSLLVDIGTNGEIVFGNNEKLYCCSTAAGPAFEGAQISCGLGGIRGAVDSAHIGNDVIEYTTIGNVEAVGICGSGIIDLVALFLERGIIDYTGRIRDEAEVKTKEAAVLLKKIKMDKNGPAFVVVEASGTASGQEIIFTQGDIREVQLAKAAISAGIATLLNKAGRATNEIENLFIAGGFGSYISKKSAAAIGLIPAELLGRTESVGNTAGLGALTCALSEESFQECEKIIERAQYIELSSDSYFQVKYIEDMVFPKQ